MINEIIEKEWKEIDKDIFLLKVYDVLHEILYWLYNFVHSNDSIKINGSDCYLSYIIEESSELIYDISVGEFSELNTYLKKYSTDYFRQMNKNNIYGSLLKMIYIYNNFNVYIKLTNSKNYQIIKIFHLLNSKKNKIIDAEFARHIGKLNSLIKWAPYHGYEFKFNDDSLKLLDTNIGNILSNINSEKLVPISTKIKNCLIETNFQTKETYMSKIAIEIAHYLKTDGKYEKYFVDENIFTKKFYKNLERENNGYFRHTSDDPGDKDKSNQWLNFNENEKIEIINQKLMIYSFILAMIENHFK